MRRLSILVAVIAILAAGCRAELRLLVDVTEQGSGTVTAEVGINEQLRNLINTLPGDGEQVIAGLDLGLVGESSTRVEDEMTVYATQAEFDNVTGIEETAAGNFTSFVLEISDQGTTLEATLDVAGELDLTQFPIDPSGIDQEALEARVIVALPGDIANNNADQLMTDGRLAWDIPFDSELYMFANTVYPKPGFPWWLIGLLTLSASLALAVWFAAVRREKKGAKQRPPAPQPPVVDSPDTMTTAGTDSPFFELGAD
ncbi:MAG: hypothetical protein GY926_04060 [bacterium]|nr:hypothetical protein [bacterium]MCP4964388.1 hypothetical protein [bacterium]